MATTPKVTVTQELSPAPATRTIRPVDVMLAGVLPTAAALSVATVILSERLQGDASAGPSIDALTSVNVWFACALAFGLTHMVGSWIVWRTGPATLLQRITFVAVFVAASFWPAFGGVFGYLMLLQSKYLLGISLVMLFIPSLLFPLVPVVPSYLFGTLLALGIAPALRTLSVRNLWWFTAFYGVACAVAGPIVTWGMFFLGLRLSSDAGIVAAGTVIVLWTISCTVVWAASLEARERGSLLRFLHSGAVYWGAAAQFILVAACIVTVWVMVESRRTVFDLGRSFWPAKLVELIRGGRPPLDVPISFLGGRFDGPFVSKSRTGARVDAFVVKLPAWTVGTTAAPVTIRLNRQRHMKLLTCPELTADIVRCRTIKPPWNEPLMLVTMPRHVYFSNDGEYEFSPAIPNVSLWRTKEVDGSMRCWLDLEDWPVSGTAARAEADCNSPWPEQAARLRALLEMRFLAVASHK